MILEPAQKVRSLAEYGAVVLGAPLYIGHWHKDAAAFLDHYQADLARRPLAFFTLGPTSTDQQEWRGVRAQLDAELAKYPGLKFAAVELFGGRYDPARLRLPDNLLAALPASPLHGLPARDVRDWAAIRAWASGLAKTLQAARAQ